MAQEWDWNAVRALCLRETRRVLGPGAHSEDAAQEAAIRAWRQRQWCRTPQHPQPWIATIARREALRVAARRGEDSLDDLPADALASPSTGDLLPDDFDSAFAQLSDDERSMIGARYWLDLSHGEIARRLGLPEGTVRVRLHRAHRRLQRALESV